MSENIEFRVIYAGQPERMGACEGTLEQVLDWLTAELSLKAWEIVDEKTSQIMSVTEFLDRTKTSKVSDSIVNKWYKMDPKIEDLVYSTKDLRNGMVVLLENADMRASQQDMESEWGMHRALERNQWCTVTEFRANNVTSTYDFTGVYENGSKIRRCYGYEHTWLVKKDSITDVAVKYAAVHAFVKAAMHKQDQPTYHGDSWGDMDVVCDQTVRSILALF